MKLNNNQFLSAIEPTMLKSCMLLVQYKGDGLQSLFPKKVLATILEGAKSVDEIKKHFEQLQLDMSKGAGKIDSAINNLQKEKIIVVTNGAVRLTEETEKSVRKCAEDADVQTKKLVQHIFDNVLGSYGKTVSNSLQIKTNIEKCLDYYFESSGYAFFGLDNGKDVKDLPKLEDIAGKDIPNDREKIVAYIIDAVGRVIDNPSAEHKATLDLLAHAFLATQVLGVDPLLENFKTTTLRDKVFFLDTDVVLNLITNYTDESVLYKNLIKKLLGCGCKIYIPEEVIAEVFNHAEAAVKRERYLAWSFDGPAERTLKDVMDNVFLEDYYLSSEAGERCSWAAFIGNYYKKKAGAIYTREQIASQIDSRVTLGSVDYKTTITDEQRQTLEDSVFDATKRTQKGQYRSDDENRIISNTDVSLFLLAKELNRIEDSNHNSLAGKPGVLSLRYYVLTTSTRVSRCASQIGLGARVLANPKAVIAYLSEIGMYKLDEIEMRSLFGNPFLFYTAQNLLPDLEKIVSLGIDLKGKNVVQMRDDLKDLVNNILTSTTWEDKVDSYSKIKSKGYSLQEAVDMSIVQAEELTKIKAELARTKAMVEKMKAENERKSRKNYRQQLRLNEVKAKRK